MFWRFGGYANVSTLDTILDKPDVTVEEILDESDVIQELKQQNSKLVEFLREEPILVKLLNYVVAEKPEDRSADVKEKVEDKLPSESERPSSRISLFGGKGIRSTSSSRHRKEADTETEQEKQEARRKKYAYVACEVLSSEVWSITEALVEQPDHLREFWQYLRRPAPLDPLQAGYFTKVNEALLDKKTEEMLSFFKSMDRIVPIMLQHVDSPMIMDLLLKIISLEKHEGGQGIVDWLQGQNLIPSLLAHLSSEHNSATQTSAGDFLKAIITISANATTQDQSVIGPNELTRQLVSDSCIRTLISYMLRGGNPLTVGVGIIIEVIRKNNSDYDLDNQVGPEPKTSDPIYLGTLLRQFANHIPDFMNLVRSPSARLPDLKAAFGRKIEPLGFDRFKTCELMAELLHCSNMGLLNERGAEEEVKKRDSERELLKAEGRLATPRAPPSPSHGNSHDEFGSSVDSHGFHHAERPTDDEMDDKPEEIRRLEVQNATDEDGFEKVNVPSADELPDEVSFEDLSDKIDQSVRGDLPELSKVDKRDPSDPRNQSPLVPSPLSPAKQSLHFDPPPTQAADSPTTAGVTERIGSLGVDEDTVMTEFGEDLPVEDDDGPSELDKELALHPEDKPAPLFVRKGSPTKEDPQTESEAHSDLTHSVATIQGQDVAGHTGQRSPFETENDGSPVVGDLLKMKFVEHRVVPTILDFFFRFPWNNFLHNVVYDVVQQVFNGTLDRGYNRTLAFDLFTGDGPDTDEIAKSLGLISCKDITTRVLDGQHASDLSQANKGMRLGYMGHLTLIAEEVCKFGNRHNPDSLDQTVLDCVNREEWIQYVEGTLAETRDRDNAVLGGVRPENAIGVRSMGMGGGGGGGGGSGAFSANTTNALANAGIGGSMSNQDSLALSEGTVGQSFEINSGTMLSGFGDAEDDDEDMGDDGILRDHQERRSQFTDDEQTTLTASPRSNLSPDPSHSSSSASSSSSLPTIPPPLNSNPPSRARVRLAERLAQRSKNSQSQQEPLPDGDDPSPTTANNHLQPPSSSSTDPTSEDEDDGGSLADHIQASLTLDSDFPRAVPSSPSSLKPDDPSARTPTGSRFSGLFSSSDSDSDGDDSSSDELFGAGARKHDENMNKNHDEDDDDEDDSSDDDDDDDDWSDGEGSAGRDVTLERTEGEFEDLDPTGGGGGTSSNRRKRRGRRGGLEIGMGLGGGKGKGKGKGRMRRMSTTTEAKKRMVLDDNEDEGGEDEGKGGKGTGSGMRGIGSSEEEEDDDDEDSEEDMVEIRVRR